MAAFALKNLTPMTEAAAAKIDTAEKVSDITARTDSLLTAREETDTAFRKAANNQVLKMVGAAALLVLGVATLGLGLVVATNLAFTLAGTAGFGIPLALAGAAGAAGGGVGFGASLKNFFGVKQAWKSLTDRVDTAVSGLIKDHPTETQGASKLAAYLKLTSRFNPAATAEQAPAAPAVPQVAPPALKA